ncbi:MAG: hypothetical protein KAX49_08205 [Halanaerobiales bacterium]|nr:hypothetical protein [Halanaerobiales bacterium]
MVDSISYEKWLGRANQDLCMAEIGFEKDQLIMLNKSKKTALIHLIYVKNKKNLNIEVLFIFNEIANPIET